MSSFTFVTSGAQADSGEGSPVEVLAAASVRVTTTFSSVDLGKNPDFALTILDAPSSLGPWREVTRQQITADRNWPGDHIQRFTVSGLQAFAKAKWTGTPRANTSAASPTMGWSFAVTGAGVP